ncbi:MAG: DUF6470 family protein [Oscillospiraceae bacterium]|nr:DUF6470 family protein [Oscillospiraceae bacterium]
MSTLRINIDQQLAQIGVRSRPAKMNITVPRGQIKISKEAPQMQIDKKDATFSVNRRKINNESGLKSPLELAKDYRNKGNRVALQSAGQFKNEGNFVANPNMPSDKAFPQVAKNRAMTRLQKKEYNIGLMPASSPEITWDKSHMRINWSKHSIVIDSDGDYMARVTLEPKSSVEVFLQTEPYFRITVEEAVSSNTYGRYIDRAI